MKLKTLILAILLPILLTNPILAQVSNNNKQNSENELEIDLNRTYSGEEVNDIIAIILDEADKAIADSYNEGYKQAVLEYKPKLLQAENNISLYKASLQKKEEMEIKSCITSFSLGFAFGFLTGGIAGFNIGVKLPL